MSYFVIEIGDQVELNITLYKSLTQKNEFDSGVVLSTDQIKNTVDVLLDSSNTVETFDSKHVVDILREYKVISINDNVDKHTGDINTLIELARIEKLYMNMNGSYNVIRTFSFNNPQLFIFKNPDSKKCLEICNEPEENHTIRLSDYRLSNISFDGNGKEAYVLDEES